MYIRSVTACAFITMFAIGLGSASDASADSVADFYRGKQIKLIIGSEAASTYDLYARVIATHMTKHIPGNPIFVPQNMIGAAGRAAANWLYNVAPKDGTAIATFSQTIPVDQARKQEGVQFDVAKFNWIGNPTVDNNITLSWSASGLSTLEEVKSKGGLICGSSGGSSPTNTFPQIINNLAGTKARIIAGYTGTSTIILAMQRGEVNCVQNIWSSSKSSLAELFRDRKLNVLVQWGAEKNPEIAAYQGHDVPLISELAHTDVDRQVINLVNSGITLGRPLVLPEGVPQDRIEAFRRAFDETMIDPEFLADAKKAQLVINPLPGEKIQQIAADVANASSDVLKRTDELMAPRDVEELKKN